MSAASPIHLQQKRVGKWVVSRFGMAALERKERTMRVLEEAVELAQAEGLPIHEAVNMVRHVYKRPPGNRMQEAAGVGVTLLAWAAARDADLWGLIVKEIDRIHELPAEHFRQRQRIKAKAGLARSPE